MAGMNVLIPMFGRAIVGALQAVKGQVAGRSIQVGLRMMNLFGRTDLTQANVRFLNDVLDFVRRHDFRHGTGYAKPNRQKNVTNVVHAPSGCHFA